MGKILEGYELSSLEWHGAEHTHLLAEAWKRAYADRNAYLADPDFVEMPLERMISASYGEERRASINMARATPSMDIGPGLGTPQREQNTTHLSVVDAEGNAVALTTTINSFYGSKVTIRGAGFLLNNEMDDFAAQPGKPNQFGLVQGENNAIEGGKRMLSAMTPTIVVRPSGELMFVVGSPGGSTIITNVFQNVSNVVDFDMNVVEAVNAPRVHHQHLPDRIQFEPGALTEQTIAELRAMGHTVEERFSPDDAYPYIGDIQAILVTEAGQKLGWSDPRPYRKVDLRLRPREASGTRGQAGRRGCVVRALDAVTAVQGDNEDQNVGETTISGGLARRRGDFTAGNTPTKKSASIELFPPSTSAFCQRIQASNTPTLTLRSIRQESSTDNFVYRVSYPLIDKSQGIMTTALIAFQTGEIGI